MSKSEDRYVRARSQPGGLPLPGMDELTHKVFGLSPDHDRLDLRALNHPVAWLSWRWRVHRHGPYAEPYDGGPAPDVAPLLLLGAVLAMVAAVLVIVLAPR